MLIYYVVPYNTVLSTVAVRYAWVALRFIETFATGAAGFTPHFICSLDPHNQFASRPYSFAQFVRRFCDPVWQNMRHYAPKTNTWSLINRNFNTIYTRYLPLQTHSYTTKSWKKSSR